MGRKLMTAETPQTSAMESLTLLMQQHEAFGQLLVTIAQRAKAEMETLETDAKKSATELDETRSELVELRAALEIEKAKLVTAQARIGRLEAHVQETRRSCDEVLAEVEPMPRNVAPDIEVNAHQGMPPTLTLLSELIGVSATMLSALVAMKGAASPEEMMRMLLVREFGDAGLQSDGREINARSSGGEEIRSAQS